jgi:hypothetical protein
MSQKIPNILKVVAFILPLAGFQAQTTISTADFEEKTYRLNHCGMVVLTTWASANILSGASCFITNSQEEKYFYGMNAAWGAVNLAIALPGLTSRKKTYDSKQKLLDSQKRTENIYLINAGLDVVYISGGFALNEVSKNQTDKNYKAMFSGFGNSILLQGSALLIFDVSMTLLNKKIHKKYLNKIMENTQISFCPQRINLRYSF